MSTAYETICVLIRKAAMDRSVSPPPSRVSLVAFEKMATQLHCALPLRYELIAQLMQPLMVRKEEGLVGGA